MRLLAVFTVLAFSGCLAADASSGDSTQTDAADGLTDAQPTVYYETHRAEMAWGPFLGTDPGVSHVVTDYGRSIAAKDDVVEVVANLEWDDTLGSSLEACVLRDGQTVPEIPCVEGPSPLALEFADEAAPLAAGEYSLTIAASSDGMPAGAAVISMVTADLTVTWKSEASIA